MVRVVYLKDFSKSDIINLLAQDFAKLKEREPKVTSAHFRKVIDFYYNKLKFNVSTGKEYVGSMVLSEFSNKRDVDMIQDYSDEDILIWEFRGTLLNETQRLANGYKLTG